jgi:phosphoglycolate phosphatase
MDRIGNQLPPERLVELMVELHEIMNGTEMEAVPTTAIITGVPELMGQLKGMGLRLGILTRSCSEYTNAALGGLLDLFDSVSCRELDAPSKPDPQALLLVCEEMGTKPRHTVLVGDHVMDAVCADLAHAMFVGVTTGSSSSADLSKLPHLAILDDLEELPSIIAKLNADG